MQALFAIVVMFGVAIHPAIETVDGKPKLNKEKVKLERVYKFND